MAGKLPRRTITPPGGVKPRPHPPKLVKVGGVFKKVTGKGAHSTGLGLHGKGRSITAKGYTGKGRYGYGQGNHGVTTAKQVTPHSKPASHTAGTRRHPGGDAGPTPPHPVGGKPPRRNPPGTKPTRTVKPPKSAGGKPPVKRTIAPAGGKKPSGVKNPHRNPRKRMGRRLP